MEKKPAASPLEPEPAIIAHNHHGWSPFYVHSCGMGTNAHKEGTATRIWGDASA